MKKNSLYILSKGKVAAVDKSNGEIVWEIKLKQYVSSRMVNQIGHIMEEDGKLFIGCGGILLCLSAKDGSLIWKNELKGWGYSYVSIANSGNGTGAAAAIQVAAASAAVVAATAS